MSERAKNKIMRDALMVALKREAGVCSRTGKKTFYLTMCAEALVDKASGGDVTALKEVFDRIDGKPHQTSEVELTGDGLKSLHAAISNQTRGLSDTSDESEQPPLETGEPVLH